MAFDILLQLDQVKGEVDEPLHVDWISLLDWSWGGHNTGTNHVAKGGGAGKASFQDISCTKYMDRSSATLLQFMSKGTHIDKGKLIVRKAGGVGNTNQTAQIPFLTIELEDIIVSSIQFGGTTEGDRYVDSFVLNFRIFTFDYKPQTSTGAAGASVLYKHDIAANVPIEKK